MTKKFSASQLRTTGRLLSVAALGALGSLVGAAWYVSERVTPPRKRTLISDYTFTPWELGMPFEAVCFQARDGLNLKGWWLPHPNPKGVIIACHGHAGRKDDLLGIGSRCWQGGYDVFVFDFRGRGESDPWPNSLISREVDDLLAAVQVAKTRAPDLPLGVIGYSMGGAVAILAAAEEPAIQALVTDCAFARADAVIRAGVEKLIGPPAAPIVRLADEVVARRFGYRFSAVRPVDRIAALSPRPILIIHANQDSLINVSHGHALYAAANHPKELWIVEGVDHCGPYFQDRDGYTRQVVAFFDQALASLPATANYADAG